MGRQLHSYSRLDCQRQHYPSEQPSPDGVLVGLVGAGNMEQLRRSSPGSTLWYMEWEAPKQMGGVYSSTNHLVDETNIILIAPFLQAND